MKERNAVVLFAAGAAAGLLSTYAVRSRRARMQPRTAQAMTVTVPHDRVEAFVTTRESMLLALGSDRAFSLIERLELRDAPGDRGTEMYLSMRRGGKYETKEVLRRVKALIEAGEIPTGRRYA